MNKENCLASKSSQLEPKKYRKKLWAIGGCKMEKPKSERKNEKTLLVTHFTQNCDQINHVLMNSNSVNIVVMNAIQSH